jgi:hypothetical protein
VDHRPFFCTSSFTSNFHAPRLNIANPICFIQIALNYIHLSPPFLLHIPEWD